MVTIPTLKGKYEKNKLLEANKTIDVKLFLESLDTQEIQEMRNLLMTLDDLIGKNQLPELKKGIRAATDELTKGLTSKLARIKSGKKGEVSVNPKSLSKVASFQAALVKGLQQLPDILDIINQLGVGLDEADSSLWDKPPAQSGSEDEWKGDGPDVAKRAAKPRKTIKSMLNAKQLSRLKSILLMAFSPPGFLAMFRGMPWVNDGKVVDELLSLPISDFESLTQKAKNVKIEVPVNKEDIKSLAQRARSEKSVVVQQKVDNADGEQKNQEKMPSGERPQPQKRKFVASVDKLSMRKDLEAKGFNKEQIVKIMKYLLEKRLINLR